MFSCPRWWLMIHIPSRPSQVSVHPSSFIYSLIINTGIWYHTQTYIIFFTIVLPPFTYFCANISTTEDEYEIMRLLIKITLFIYFCQKFDMTGIHVHYNYSHSHQYLYYTTHIIFSSRSVVFPLLHISV